MPSNVKAAFTSKSIMFRLGINGFSDCNKLRDEIFPWPAAKMRVKRESMGAKHTRDPIKCKGLVSSSFLETNNMSSNPNFVPYLIAVEKRCARKNCSARLDTMCHPA